MTTGVYISPERARRGAWIGAVVSLVLHTCAVAFVWKQTERASLDVSFVVPVDVQFGLTDPMHVEEAPPSEPQDEPPAPTTAGGASSGMSFDGGVPPTDARIDAPDAPTDASRKRARRDGGRRARSDGGAGEGEVLSEPGRFGAFAPPGAQVALRVDLGRVRASPLADDVRQLLAAIPDWRLVLEGSGIDPLDDLDRLMLASPNLRRETMVLAGSYRGEEARVRDAVAAIAAAQGAIADWRDEGGIAVAPWRNADETERVLALVGPNEFAIARPTDLPRVLAVARARSARMEAAGAAPPTSEGEGLVALGEGEALAIDVEGARTYLRGAGVMPKSIHLAVREEDRSHVHVFVDAAFDDSAEAERALAFWEERRDRLAGDFGVRISGFSQTVAEALLVQQGENLHAELLLRYDQVRFLLGLLQGMFEPRPAPAPTDPLPGFPPEFPQPSSEAPAPVPPIGALPEVPAPTP